LTSSAFVALALSYSLGSGALSLKGSAANPCLEIKRSELQKTYLEHQFLRLKKLAPGDVKHKFDLVPTSTGVYSRMRLQMIAPEQGQAYKLLYPQDEFQISRQVLEIVGLEGLTALWLDRGQKIGYRYVITDRRWRPLDWLELASYLDSLGQPVRLYTPNTSNSPKERAIPGIELLCPKKNYPIIFRDLAPLVHRSMRDHMRLISPPRQSKRKAAAG